MEIVIIALHSKLFESTLHHSVMSFDAALHFFASFIIVDNKIQPFNQNLWGILVGNNDMIINVFASCFH